MVLGNKQYNDTRWGFEKTKKDKMQKDHLNFASDNTLPSSKITYLQ